MNSHQVTNSILFVMAGCLAANTIVFVLPVAYRAIKNEAAWIDTEKKNRLAEKEEANRLAEAQEMCTQERLSLFSEAIRSPGKEWLKETERKIRALPKSVGPKGFFRGFLNLWLARSYYQINPANVDLPLTVEGCREAWPNFPVYRKDRLPKAIAINKSPKFPGFVCNSYGCDHGKPPKESNSKQVVAASTSLPLFPFPAIPAPSDPASSFLIAEDSAKIQSQGAIKHYNLGVAASLAGDKNRAISHWSQAIAVNPQFAEAYLNRGAAKYDLGDKPAAISDYSRAIAINSKYAKAYNNRGNAKSALGDHYGAIADFSQAISINPRLALGYYNRGVTYEVLSDLKKASLQFAAGFDDLKRACSDFRAAALLGDVDASGMAKRRCRFL